MQPKTRMTFRFEPPKPAPKPPAGLSETSERRIPRLEDKAAETIPSEPTGKGPGGWNAGGPLQDDIFALEEIIRQTNGLSAASPLRQPGPASGTPQARLTLSDKDAEQERDPHEPAAEFGQPMPGTAAFGRIPRTEGPSWWRVFASVGGAVVTGALFGYLVLSLFTGDEPFPGKPVPSAEAPAQAKAASPEAGASAASSPAASGLTDGNPAAIPEETIYLLQYGVFRTEAGMKAAAEQLVSKGVAHAEDGSEGYRVFAGTAATKEEAQRLAGYLSGLAVYAKPTVLASVGNLPGGEAGQKTAEFVTRSGDLIRKLSMLSIDALQDDSPQPIDEAEMEALRELHRLWLDLIPAAGGLAGAAREDGQALIRSLNAAMVSLDDYGRNMSRFHLWSVQSAVTDAVLTDRALRAHLTGTGGG